MAKQYISHLSKPVSNPELDIFSVPATSITIDKTCYREYYPQNPLTDVGPYIFNILASPEFIDFNKNYLLMEIRIVKSDGSALDGGGGNPALVSPINSIVSSLFNQMKLNIQGKEVMNSGTEYYYRALLEALLNYNDSAKETHLDLSGFSTEVCSDGIDIDHEGHDFFKERAEKYAASAWVQLMGRLPSDLFNQSRYMLPYTNISMTLNRNPDTNTLLCYSIGNTDTFKIEIRKLVWYVKHVGVLPSVTLAIEKVLSTTNAKYPIKRVEIATQFIAAGRKTSQETPIIEGQLPVKAIVGFVEASAYHGALDKNPYHFKPFDIQEIYMVSGPNNYPVHPFRPNFAQKQFAREYIQFHNALNLDTSNTTNDITPYMFRYGTTLFAFNLAPDESAGDAFSLTQNGALTLKATFRSAIPAGGIVAVFYLEYENLLEISKNRDCLIDYRI